MLDGGGPSESSQDSFRPTDPPTCECGASMVIRTARRGPNAGGQFWGCSVWRKGESHSTFPLDTASASGTAVVQPGPPRRPVNGRGPERKVHWRDGTMDRPGWMCRYTAGGASLR